MTGAMKELDVRSILRDGGEPFPVIMETVAGLGPGEGLRLVATFRPVPLFSVMARHGYDHQANEIGNGEWEVLFTPVAAPDMVVLSPPGVTNPDTWPDPSEYLDLSAADAAGQISQVLDAVDDVQPGEVIFALFAAEPVALYNELFSRGHMWTGNFDTTRTAFRMFIRVGKGGGSH